MKRLQIVWLLLVPWLGVAHADDQAKLSVDDSGKALTFRQSSRTIATYVYADDKILRPFFSNVHSPGGVKVTRNFPPIPGTDETDHDTMHPGIWLAFGDVSGSDFWRNKGRVRHEGFLGRPRSQKSVAQFVQQKRYLTSDARPVCDEVCRCSVRILPNGVLIEFDSTFTSDHEFYFGDQEEMGLGIRVATAITEKQGGRITDSEGRTGADKVWSQSSTWCDYSGKIDDQEIGITILCHPENFRGSWMHARDYGVIAANAFGRAAMRKGLPDKTIVRPGESLRLRYGVYVHEGTNDPDASYQTYLKLTDKP